MMVLLAYLFFFPGLDMGMSVLMESTVQILPTASV